MILSASRRTDIPCFFSEWFINRLKAGYVLTRNPFNHAQLSRITISPEVVDCIVFWTKDPQNMLPWLQEIDDMGYPYYFQFTLTPYNSELEKNLRNKADIENTFIKLSRLIGKDRCLWRYDPIILNSSLSLNYHKEQFLRLCEKLHQYTERVTISFVDTYPKLKTDLLRELSEDEISELAYYIGVTAKSYGLTVTACCEKTDLSIYGIKRARCIDKTIIERICGYNLGLTADKNQRSGCGCVESIDIGAYNTCMNGCIYCYANNSPASTLNRYNLHNKEGELLAGTAAPGDKITLREVRSNRT